jgi:SPW repeat
MATRNRIRTRADAAGAYDAARPAPDEAYIEPAPRLGRRLPDGDAAAAATLNVLAGIWLIISPFVLGYTGADATWNPIVFGAIICALALARLAGGARAAEISVVNMAIGVWLFISAFWLATSSQASWNVGILGVVVFVLAAWASSPGGGRARTV